MFIIIIYKAVNLVNGKVYIGQTIHTLNYRKAQHKCETNRPSRKRTKFHNVIVKYGFENFEFSVIDSAESIEELNEKEAFWIEQYKSNTRDYGYNLDSGGKNCKKSDSTKALISKCKLEHWKDEEVASRMRLGLVAATDKWIETSKERRVRCVCENCGKEFFLPPHQARNRKYCSHQCADSINLRTGSAVATKVIMERHKLFASEVKGYIEKWGLEHKDFVMSCKLNQVSTHYSQLFAEVTEKYGIKDPRSIVRCVTGSNNKKDFALYMKGFVSDENVCRTGLN